MIASASAASGATVFAVGVGTAIDADTHAAIASGGGSVFQVGDFAALLALVNTIVEEACPTTSTLTLVKTVVTDDSGSAVVGDFALFINGAPATGGVAIGLAPGTYTACETPQSGYTTSAWGGDCTTGGSVALALGDNKTCTITSDDQPAQLTVTKIVVNDDGGGAQVADFPLFVDGGSVTSGDANAIDAGPHTVSETGYSATIGGDCAADGTVAAGESAECTITNDDDSPPSSTITRTQGSWSTHLSVRQRHLGQHRPGGQAVRRDI